MELGGLLGGVTAWHLRVLCENPWNGGGGYTPAEVGDMTLDQVWFRLCDVNLLKREVGERTEAMQTARAIGELKPAGDGTVAGRAADGTPIRGRMRGRSRARELMEQQQGVGQEKQQRRKRKGGQQGLA